MRETFRPMKISAVNELRLQTINDILEEYSRQGYRLTLRQLYYQLVSKAIIPNCQKEYAKLSKLLKEGRMGGVINWSLIEDRIRKPQIPYSVEGIQDAMQDTLQQYRLDRQEGQDIYIEVWIEKDALVGIVSRVTSEFHIRLMVNRGYSSCSAMYNAYKRIDNHGKPALILYFGDHDPSGIDMVRDIVERFKEFGLDAVEDVEAPPVDFDDCVNVHRVALTMDQIEEYDPPPNPAKITDPRAKDYIKKYGDVSWELDAIPPASLAALVKDKILETIDISQYASMIDKENEHKSKIEKFIKKCR